MYYFWCPNCNFTERCSKDETGDYKDHSDYECECDSTKIDWDDLRIALPTLPEHPQKEEKIILTHYSIHAGEYR